MPSHIIHPIPPVFDTDSRILILGSFPSVKSRESCFFYGHPQNRFWKLLARLRKEDIPSSVEEKKAFLLRNHIAVWDTIHSCSIEGSSDSSIRDVVPNDLASILDHASIQAIYTNGGLSGKMYDRFCRKQTGIEAIKLPSTSPANAAWNLDRLTDAWKCINQILGEPGSEVSYVSTREAPLLMHRQGTPESRTVLKKAKRLSDSTLPESPSSHTEAHAPDTRHNVASAFHPGTE